jgi:hypothetical protein
MNGLSLRMICLALLLNLVWGATAHTASTSATVRIGYIDTPGSGLALLAAARNAVNGEGPGIEAVKVVSPESGLSLLNDGALDAVAVDALSALREISANDRIAIFAGSGYLSSGPPNELEADASDKALSGRIVVVALRQRLVNEQRFFNTFIHALIRAYSNFSQNQEAALAAIRPYLKSTAAVDTHSVFDPNPGYDGLARLWKVQGLQRQGQPRSYLSDHVNEEYFCDALYLLLEQTPKDPGLNQLLKRAVCPPDCCPVGKKASAQGKSFLK